MLMLRQILLMGLCMLALSACDSDKQAEEAPQTQQYFFLESLNQVESAGINLQNKSLKSSDLQQALSGIDSAIKLAFQVEKKYLDRFDPRLSKNYQRYFVKGIESYRLGIEAGDHIEQKQGLRLMALWAKFWDEAGKDITAKMTAG